MAIDPVLTSTTALRSRDRAGAEHLGELVRTMELVAAEMDAPGQSTTERSVLRSRFHDLQRQVNRLDGIVAGEGLESSGQTPSTGSVTRPDNGANTGTGTDQAPANMAHAERAADAPAASHGPAPVGTSDQVDIIA